MKQIRCNMYPRLSEMESRKKQSGTIKTPPRPLLWKHPIGIHIHIHSPSSIPVREARPFRDFVANPITTVGSCCAALRPLI
ncbi:Uncharacterized protein HZ326_4336, partial [Fusarium oxysporum f. sp. albedinis]